MMRKRRKPSMNVEHRLTKLEDAYKTMNGKLDEIKNYVSNHIVHALEDTNKDLKILLDRKQEADAVKAFLNNSVKLSVSLASVTWVVMQIFTHSSALGEGLLWFFTGS
jgi:hypothetical protein